MRGGRATDACAAIAPSAGAHGRIAHARWLRHLAHQAAYEREGEAIITENIADKLAPYGIDWADAEDRFDGNVDLYKRMALKYENDGHLVALEAAMDVKDYDEAHKQAHALKGVAGNLSFAKLFELAAVISDALKEGEPQAAAERMGALAEAHATVLEGLEVLRES